MCIIVAEWRCYDGSIFRMAFSPGNLAYLAVVFRKHPFAVPLVIFVAIFLSEIQGSFLLSVFCRLYKYTLCSISSQFVDAS